MRRPLPCVAPLRCLVFCAGCQAGCFPMEFCSNAPASNSSVTAPLPATTLSGCPLPAASCSVASPGQQQLSHHGAPASSSFPMALRCSAPASNKPHPAEKSTPVWLAIWCTWAGFANSQLLRATFCSIYLYRCAHSPSYHIELLLRQTQICRPICTDCLRHLHISAR